MKIELINFCKSYTASVLKDISFTFKAGKLYVVKGVSGCGKTTLLNLIGGLDAPSSGSVLIDGDKPNIENTSYVFQNSLLVSKLTVMENLLLIENAPEKISELANRFEADDILLKYPSQISGGERQRISIIRALLKTPKVILADEPTASLDDGNSALIAGTIAGLRSPDRIVIVATHEPYFDKYADEIVDLRYGTIESSTLLTPEISENTAELNIKTHKRKAFSGPRYALTRNPKILSPGNLLPLALVFLIVFLVSAVQANFSREYLRFIKDEYPLDITCFTAEQLEGFRYKDKLKIYKCYTASDRDYTAYYLPDEKDSIFRIKGLISHGEYPKNDHEIIASNALLAAYFGDSDSYSGYVGKKVIFLGEEFTVSGTLDSTDGDIEFYLAADHNYTQLRRTVNCKAVFVPYETLKRIGEEQSTLFITCVYDGLYEDEDARAELEKVRDEKDPNSFYASIEESQQTLDHITVIFVIILFIVYITACIFMLTVIGTELFYRKRELGYLQIFGLNKKRITILVFSEYFIKITASLACAVVLYAATVIIYALLFGSVLIFDLLFTVVIIASLFGVYLVFAYFRISRFFRKRIIDLIN